MRSKDKAKVFRTHDSLIVSKILVLVPAGALSFSHPSFGVSVLFIYFGTQLRNRRRTCAALHGLCLRVVAFTR